MSKKVYTAAMMAVMAIAAASCAPTDDAKVLSDASKSDVAARTVNATPTQTDEPVETTEANRVEAHTLTYKAYTDATSATVTYVGENFSIGQDVNVPMPWEFSIEGVGSPFEVFGANMSVQQMGDGVVTCEIWWDDELVATNQSSGLYAVTTCMLPTDI